jgi:hypothetical protein
MDDVRHSAGVFQAMLGSPVQRRGFFVAGVLRFRFCNTQHGVGECRKAEAMWIRLGRFVS